MTQELKIDTMGKDCPIPLLELKKAIKNSNKGDIVEILFTCPEAVETLPSYCAEQNHEVLEFDKKGLNGWVIKVKN
ncbi:hypothetical protein IGI39_001435 [Enterococcus sp. AZ135]|uniref:sulfurtransferase TusA family protein n=1 Tax=unclassified Enterococcus TaxID=2608891 RepID=UPI003F20EDB8